MTSPGACRLPGLADGFADRTITRTWGGVIPGCPHLERVIEVVGGQTPGMNSHPGRFEDSKIQALIFN